MVRLHEATCVYKAEIARIECTTDLAIGAERFEKATLRAAWLRKALD